jgi:hypothetical protein
LDLIHPQAQAYAEDFTSPEDALLKEVNAYTLQHHTEYVMLSGHVQGNCWK